MCKGNEDAPAEVNSARCISIAILVFSILTLIGFIAGAFIGSIGAFFGIIGSSILVCCGPGEEGGAGKEIAAMVLFILAGLIEILGAALSIVFFLAAVTSAQDSCSYGCPEDRRLQSFSYYDGYWGSYYDYWGSYYDWWGSYYDYYWGSYYGWGYGTYSSFGYSGWGYGWGYSGYSYSWCDDDTINDCVTTTIGIAAIFIFPSVILMAITGILTLVGVCKANSARKAISDGDKVGAE